jgi:hypothetical protein
MPELTPSHCPTRNAAIRSAGRPIVGVSGTAQSRITKHAGRHVQSVSSRPGRVRGANRIGDGAVADVNRGGPGPLRAWNAGLTAVIVTARPRPV